jgi:hypothetical protein
MPLNVGGPYSAVLGAPLDATLTFVARILRSGLLDPPGIYNTTIPVSFS